MDQQEPQPLSVRTFAKHIAQSAVGLGASTLTARAVDNYTPYDPNAFIVKLGAGAVGFIVASKLQPLTDAAVDKSADFVAAKRQARRDRKNESE
jgi:hypothetical protein